MVGDLFDKLDGEKPGEKRRLRLKTSEDLQSILACFEKNCIQNPEKQPGKRDFRMVSKILPAQVYARDILAFSTALAGYEDHTFFDHWARHYLMNLIERCRERNVTIALTGLRGQMSMLGQRNNGKEVRIIGDAGNVVGYAMRSGSIAIKGNVGDYAGYKMKGGEIRVDGNAGNAVGECMEGGAIYLNGNYQSISGMVNGNIYHKGKHIIKEGKKL